MCSHLRSGLRFKSHRDKVQIKEFFLRHAQKDCFKSHRDKVQINDTIEMEKKKLETFQIPQGQSSNILICQIGKRCGCFKSHRDKVQMFKSRKNDPINTGFKSHRDKVQIPKFPIRQQKKFTFQIPQGQSSNACSLDQHKTTGSFKSHRDKVQISWKYLNYLDTMRFKSHRDKVQITK